MGYALSSGNELPVLLVIRKFTSPWWPAALPAAVKDSHLFDTIGVVCVG